MKSAAILAVLAFGAPLSAHRLDEYLQATLVSLQTDHVQASMRLIPGVAVAPAVIAAIDQDRDGDLSSSEQLDYARRVLRDLSVSVDGRVLQPRLLSASYPSIGEMRQGVGEIHIEFSAPLAPGSSRGRLVIENHHQSRISVYLMNCLVPGDRGIQVLRQVRNENQSWYLLDFAQHGTPAASLLSRWTALLGTSPGEFGSFPSMFRLGMQHIAEGTDHLLFLLALLLPAPLRSARSRWGSAASVRTSLVQILRVVTAFTVGHSLTLALAALGFVHVAARPIEVLIAVSILVSAVHALRPLFPGREALISGSFGLIHGLAFATTLGNLGLDWRERLGALCGFNFGIETMQLLVVGTTLPSLLVLSRTPAYPIVRIAGALFAGMASLGWIAERLLKVPLSIDVVVDAVAHQALPIAVGLFVTGVICWSYQNRFRGITGHGQAMIGLRVDQDC